MLRYNVFNWYWIVDGSDTQVYSSAAGAKVSVTDSAYVAWLEAGGVPTQIVGNDLLKMQISLLENKQTERRMREAALGIDGGWLENLNTQIDTLRDQIT